MNFHCRILHAQANLSAYHPNSSQQLRTSLQRSPGHDCWNVGVCHSRERQHPASMWKRGARRDTMSLGAYARK